MKKLQWRRVVIDKETGWVANENLIEIDPNWENKDVIWKEIEEYEHIPQDEVEELFGLAAPSISLSSPNPTSSEADQNDKQAEPTLPIREYFDPQSRDKLVVIIKHLASPEKVLLALENLDEKQVDIDRLGLLVKQWEVLEVAGLVAEYN